MFAASRRPSARLALSALALCTTCLVTMPAAAQTGAPAAAAAPPPPAGGYYTATGARTADYNAALQSWREDAQFAVDYSKANLGLEYAYVMGLTGKGQTIGINDSGVLVDHPLFSGAGKFTGLRTAIPAGYGNDGLVNQRRRWEIHGTHVAGTAAGNRVAGERSFGNAFGANIFSATANFAAGDFLWWKDEFIDGTTVATPRENIVDLASTGQVRIINNSWGSGTTLPYTATLAQARATFVQNLGDFYQPVLDNDVLVVFSAGNGGGVHASIDAVTPLNDPRLRGNWLSVTNYLADGTAAASTSLCGQTATWCVSGPGSAIISSALGYTVNVDAIRATYTAAAYPGIYAGRTVAQLQSAANTAWINVLNGYLSRRAAAQAAGRPFDEAGERTLVAREAVGISLAYGARFVGGDPNGYTSTLANILVSNVNLFTPEFVGSVLTQADALISAELARFITYTGPGYAALTGTSMAAPNVSGFAALLMEAFPEYNTALISDILVSSSRDLDTPGVDLRSGWGAPQMGTALRGPTALRAVREVEVAGGTVDVWSNDITDARDRYSAEVLAGFGNDIGGLTKRGAGELILAGTNSYTGPTRADQGLLTVNGRITASAVTIGNGGTLGGNGTVPSFLALSGGTVAPGSAGAIGTLTVAGDAVFNAGSTLLIDVGASGSSDRLVANRAQLGGTLTLAPLGQLPRYGASYTVLTTTDGTTGRFDAATPFSAILYPEVRYAGGQVQATIAARPYASVVDRTPVQTAYARLLDGNRPAYASLRNVYDALDLQSVGTIRASLEQLAPTTETTRRAIGTVGLDNMARFYRERTGAMRPGSFAGGQVALIGKPLQFAANAIVMPGQPQTVSDTPATVVREGALPSTVSAYLAGGYVDGSSRPMPGTILGGGRDKFDGFFIAGGLEAQVTDTAVLGFGLSYTDLDADRRLGRKTDGKLILGTLYGRLGEDFGAALDTQFSAGVYESRTHRTGTFAGTPFDLRGRDNSFALSTELGASYAFGSDALRIAPRAAVRASRIEYTPLVETGTGPALAIAKDDFLSVQGRAGLQLDGNRAGFRPVASAYFVHDFKDRPDVFFAGLAGGTGIQAPFLVAGQDRNWGELSAGLAYGTERFEFSVALDGTVGREDVRNRSYRAGVTVRF
ncbi:S8 family serine peptidase [Sphingomonas olei]|uniref:Autotransporter domain-containing protein n=2 Tax=Pseudomonadota TaxID=1224 RepID=A0ABY2QF50_9SPHN|nr:S8 family serine peptidase [Sphingomonas olei]THG39053.1 autotransporter domain-containing protein [Sphingomonas olei]